MKIDITNLQDVVPVSRPVIRRVARAQAKRSVIVADSSKFGRLGSIHTFGLQDVHAVITGGALTRDFTEQFNKSHVDIIYA